MRPEEVVKITTGYHTFNHLHDASERPRDYSKVGDQWEAGLHRDKVTGELYGVAHSHVYAGTRRKV